MRDIRIHIAHGASFDPFRSMYVRVPIQFYGSVQGTRWILRIFNVFITRLASCTC